MVTLPPKVVEPNYQIKYQMCKNKRRAESHFVTTLLLCLNFKSKPSQNGLLHTYTHSSALSDSDISPIRQMFLTPLLAVPLRTEALSLHLSPVSHGLKQLVRHRSTYTQNEMCEGINISVDITPEIMMHLCLTLTPRVPGYPTGP